MERMTVSGRPPDRKSLIVEHLREEIVAGRLAPGAQLPTRAEIEQRFGSGTGTVQRALDHLVRDGFVHSKGPKGTFVSSHPPHLTNFPLIFKEPFGEGGNKLRFSIALTNEAMKYERQGQITLPRYYGVNGHTDSEDFGRLLRDVASQRVAGLIFMFPPRELWGTPLLDQPGIPRLAVMETKIPGVPAIRLGSQGALQCRALDYLASQGRQRIAMIASPAFDPPEVFAAQVAQRGMTTRPHWLLRLGLDAPSAARECAGLLMDPGQSIRPDGLIVADDNMVEYATAGLVQAGARVPDDITVVAHCNFPWPTPSVLPVQRLGYDVRGVLETCFRIFNRQRRGEAVESMHTIAPVFEDELDN